MNKVKLTYFGANGRAFIPRLILHYSKIDFENIVLSYEEWNKQIQFSQFKYLPLLEINEKEYTQSISICVKLARKADLMGKSDEDEYQIMFLLNHQDDLANSLISLIYNKNESISEELFTIASEKITLIAKAWESIYKKNGSKKFFLSSGLSLCDFSLLYYINTINYFESNFEFKTLFKKYAPSLNSMIDELTNENWVKSFYESDLYIKGSF